MNFVAELRLLPKTKFRDISPQKGIVKEYEFKSEHLRAYAFHLEGKGKILVCWGFKNNQEEDIRRFRSIKKRFFNE